MQQPERRPNMVHAQVTEAWQLALPGTNPALGFFDQGGTSIRAVLLIAELEKRLGVAVPFGQLVLAEGVDGLVDWIVSNG